MNVDGDKLIIDDKIDAEDYEELLELASNDEVKQIIVDTNDIHPAIFQILFVLSKEKKIVIEDEFNQRFFENLKLAS